jgi:hypothetical protein
MMQASKATHTAAQRNAKFRAAGLIWTITMSGQTVSLNNGYKKGLPLRPPPQ